MMSLCAVYSVDKDFVLAERVGKRHHVHGLAAGVLEALDRHCVNIFLPFFVQMGLEMLLSPCRASISGTEGSVGSGQTFAS